MKKLEAVNVKRAILVKKKKDDERIWVWFIKETSYWDVDEWESNWSSTSTWWCSTFLIGSSYIWAFMRITLLVLAKMMKPLQVFCGGFCLKARHQLIWCGVFFISNGGRLVNAGPWTFHTDKPAFYHNDILTDDLKLWGSKGMGVGGGERGGLTRSHLLVIRKVKVKSRSQRERQCRCEKRK